MKIFTRTLVCGVIVVGILFIISSIVSHAYAQTPGNSSAIRDFINSLPKSTSVTIEYESPVTLIMKVEESDGFIVGGKIIDFAKQKGYKLDSASAYTEPFEDSYLVHVRHMVYMSKAQ